MANQSPHTTRHSNRPLVDAASGFAGATLICLLSLCSGCQLGGDKPSDIRFLKSELTRPEAKDVGLLTAGSQQAQVKQAGYSQAKAELSKQKAKPSDIGLVAFVQDNDSSSRRLEFEQPQLDDANQLAEVGDDADEPTVGNRETDDRETNDREVSDGESGSDGYNDTNIDSDGIKSLPQSILREPTGNANGISVDAVLQSTLDFYPDIDVALEELSIANGNQIQAAGGFDTKVKVASENTPVGFYESFRSNFGVEQPTFKGGSVFAGYRFGRGDFEPWYLERNTNALGELKLGANWNLLRGRQIDDRRVALWQAEIKRDAVEPVVHQQLLSAFRDAEIAYWNWVASGQVYQRSLQLLEVAKNRVDGIEQRIKAGDLAEITRTDNDRTILGRQVKLIKAKAKLDQAAIKLSLYYRDANGTPIIATEAQLPGFDSGAYQIASNPEQLVYDAVSCRPETRLLELDIQAIDLDLAKAKNDLMPQLNASFVVSQDFGRPTSAAPSASSISQTLSVVFDEKDQFQVDAGLFLSQSLQLRKARGKIQSLQGKRRQLVVKKDFVGQKIAAEVQQNYQLTVAAREQILAGEQNYALAQKLSDAARKQIETGDVDLFEIILREQQELDAAIDLVASQFAFFSNRATLNASVGCEEYQSYQRFLRQR